MAEIEPITGDMVTTSDGTTFRYTGSGHTWITVSPPDAITTHVELTDLSGVTRVSSSSCSSFTDSTGTTWTDTSGSWTVGHDPINVVDPDQITVENNTEDEIDEDTQKEIDKIGIPGKRDINDLLASFKVVKDPKKKLSAIEQLEDESWVADAFDSSTEPETEIPSESRGT